MVMDGEFLAYLPDVMIRNQLDHGELRRLDVLPESPPTALSAWRRAGTSTRNQVVLTALRRALEESLDLECSV